MKFYKFGEVNEKLLQFSVDTKLLNVPVVTLKNMMRFAALNKQLNSISAIEVKKIDDVIQQYSGMYHFDKVVATPNMMSVVGRLGRILGPKGLMPS